MQIQLSRKSFGKDIFVYEHVGEFFATSRPTLMDPFEQNNVYIAESMIEGMTTTDGVYAKKSIPGEL